MPLGRKVGLDLSDIVLDGDRALSSRKKGAATPQFLAHVCCAQTAGWIKMPLGTEVGLNPSDILLDMDPAPPPQKADTAPNFSPMSIVAKRSPISATAQHLYSVSIKWGNTLMQPISH